ncbi:hypothetical protein AX14_001860 [Amanita brunnescens Koide BX004]|nr:hypothetical protein AX14_001860 [Amanita brunnescens Koide BX004]
MDVDEARSPGDSIFDNQQTFDLTGPVFGGTPVQSPRKKDDTSPCARAEKRKKKVFHLMDHHEEKPLPPKKVRITMESLIVSTSSSKFGGGEQMIGKKGLGGSVLVGRGEDTSIPFLLRPLPLGCSRWSACTSSSGRMLQQTTHPFLVSISVTSTCYWHSRTWTRSLPQIHFTRPHYDVLQVGNTHYPAGHRNHIRLGVLDGLFPDSERGIVTLDKYYALRTEADHTIVQSKRIWADTPFSLTVQNFRPF